MMNSISNASYPSDFIKHISIPVIVDTHKTLAGPFAAAGNPPPNTFTFCLDDAISLADRHLRIQGRPPNPVQIVSDFTNLLRWECGTFWRCDVATNWVGHNTGGAIQFGSEHARRSGELLAEGIALLFLGEWLKVPRQMIYFIVADDARPDYRFRFRSNSALGMMFKNLNFGIEVRSRVSPKPLKNRTTRTRLFKSDYNSIKNKKNNQSAHSLSGILAVYFYYGILPGADAPERPRLHLADPVCDEKPYSKEMLARTLVDYYLGTTSRIGLWGHHDRLKEAREIVQQGKYPEPQLSTPPFPRQTGELLRSFGNHKYWGREFSYILEIEARYGKKLATALVRSGFLGSTTFHGVNEDVLRLIERFDWEKLGMFFDPNTSRAHRTESPAASNVPARVTSDGVVKHEFYVDDEVATHLRKRYGLER